MHQRKIIKMSAYANDNILRVSCSLTGPDQDALQYLLGEDEDDELMSFHVEPMFNVLKRGVRHMGYGSINPFFSRGASSAARRKGLIYVPKKVLARARKTLIRSRLRDYVLSRLKEFWNDLDMMGWCTNAATIGSFILLLVLVFKGNNVF